VVAITITIICMRGGERAMGARDRMAIVRRRLARNTLAIARGVAILTTTATTAAAAAAAEGGTGAITVPAAPAAEPVMKSVVMDRHALWDRARARAPATTTTTATAATAAAAAATTTTTATTAATAQRMFVVQRLDHKHPSRPLI